MCQIHPFEIGISPDQMNHTPLDSHLHTPLSRASKFAKPSIHRNYGNLRVLYRRRTKDLENRIKALEEENDQVVAKINKMLK